MSLLNQSNIYLIIIPRNYTNDIHICGRCKIQYTLLNLFLKHKETCNENELKTANSDALSKKAEIDNIIGFNSSDSFYEIVGKDPNQLHLLNHYLIKEENQLKQAKFEQFEGQGLCVSQKIDFFNNDINEVEPKANLMVDCKRTLQNDEEDIATLLANHLGSEISADNMNIHPQQNELEETESKKIKNEDETKVMYRGKMRKLFSCKVDGCTYKTLLKKDIERHSRVHTGERPFKCFLCEKAFNRTDKLLLHQRIHAGDKRYKCTKCDYASVDSGSLIKHLRVHNGERPFKCQLCSYRARDSSQLTVHLRTHTGDSPFICTNNKCKAAFKTNSDLKRHMVVHSEEKPYSCMYCPYKSTLKRNLHIHIQSQHPNGEYKEYKCQICPTLVLPTSRKLKNHIRKHHGITDDANKNLTDRIVRRERDGSLVDGNEISKNKKAKNRKNSDKIAVGIMSKAYDCKLCDASFVCQDSLFTHQRYHSKIEEMLKVEVTRENTEFSTDSRRNLKRTEDIEKKLETFDDGDLELNDTCITNSSFNDSLRNAEILASLTSPHELGHVKQYVMVAPETIENAYNSEEYILVEN